MNEPFPVTLLLSAVRLYLALGAAFALAFVLFGVQRIDPAARRSSIGFRVLILPGVVLLWPLLTARWLGGRVTPSECNAHRLAAHQRRRGAGTEGAA